MMTNPLDDAPQTQTAATGTSASLAPSSLHRAVDGLRHAQQQAEQVEKQAREAILSELGQIGRPFHDSATVDRQKILTVIDLAVGDYDPEIAQSAFWAVRDLATNADAANIIRAAIQDPQASSRILHKQEELIEAVLEGARQAANQATISLGEGQAAKLHNIACLALDPKAAAAMLDKKSDLSAWNDEPAHRVGRQKVLQAILSSTVSREAMFAAAQFVMTGVDDQVEDVQIAAVETAKELSWAVARFKHAYPGDWPNTAKRGRKEKEAPATTRTGTKTAPASDALQQHPALMEGRVVRRTKAPADGTPTP